MTYTLARLLTRKNLLENVRKISSDFSVGILQPSGDPDSDWAPRP